MLKNEKIDQNENYIMNKQTCLIIFLISCRICSAQNLVPNGDFEQYSGCPVAFTAGQLDSSLYWFNPALWPPGGSPDYYNQCASGNLNVPNTYNGYQQSHSGVAFSGIALWANNIPDIREYIETPLTSMLVANNCYQFEMYINAANSMQFVSDDIQVYFSDTAISGINNWYPLPFTPQIHNPTGNLPDTLNWTLVSGNFVASGGEQYLIIGNFKSDTATSTILINNLVQWPYAYIYIDDVCLTPCSTPCFTSLEEHAQTVEVNIYPNPLRDKLNISVRNNETSEIILYDIASRKLLHQEFTRSVSINVEQLSKGIYVYEVRNKMGLLKQGKIIKEYNH